MHFMIERPFDRKREQGINSFWETHVVISKLNVQSGDRSEYIP